MSRFNVVGKTKCTITRPGETPPKKKEERSIKSWVVIDPEQDESYFYDSATKEEAVKSWANSKGYDSDDIEGAEIYVVNVEDIKKDLINISVGGLKLSPVWS